MDTSVMITLGFLVFAIVMFAWVENSIVYYRYGCSSRFALKWSLIR